MHTVVISLFLVQLAATVFMTGLIWFVQIVHYPLFADVGDAYLVRYARRHGTLTGYVVGGPMLLELATSLVALAPSFRPSFLSAVSAAASALLVLLLWLSTGLVQVPLHERLGRRHDPACIVQLVSSNWIRTAAWTARSVLLLACLHRAL